MDGSCWKELSRIGKLLSRKLVQKSLGKGEEPAQEGQAEPRNKKVNFGGRLL